jgi:hypothetical protein
LNYSKRQSWRITSLGKSSNMQRITRKENSSQTRLLRLATWKMRSFKARKELNLCTSTFKIITQTSSTNGMNQFLQSLIMMMRTKSNRTIQTVRTIREWLDNQKLHKASSLAP